ncbi:MAG: hypothetical protein LJE84_13510, partial [Gammaproteobacteria bacterium]|nr:hypothetical protein [Gammaproteobacteria bacterium]
MDEIVPSDRDQGKPTAVDPPTAGEIPPGTARYTTGVTPGERLIATVALASAVLAVPLPAAAAAFTERPLVADPRLNPTPGPLAIVDAGGDG